ncbi:hypothetical protein Hanom_Chr17g01553551 [Helianthus anomalus]
MGLGLGRCPRGGSLKSGVGRASDPMWQTPIRFVGHAGVCIFFLITCQATPQPKPYYTPRTRHSPMGGLQLYVSTHVPNPSSTIPDGLMRRRIPTTVIIGKH